MVKTSLAFIYLNMPLIYALVYLNTPLLQALIYLNTPLFIYPSQTRP
jgi:hypothetical protein